MIIPSFRRCLCQKTPGKVKLSTDGMLRGGEFGYLVDSFREHLTDTAQQLFPCIMPHSGSLVGFRSKSPLLILPIHGFSVSRL